MQASCDLCCARLGRLLGLRRGLVLRDVPADGFLVLFSEAAGIGAVSDRIYWPDPACEFLCVTAVCACIGSSARKWKGLNGLLSQ